MKSIEMKAKAKINLSLDVLGKRSDGYHNVKMVMQSIGLYDRVYIETTESGIEIICDTEFVPSNKDNIAYKAAELMFAKYALDGGVKIKIDKRIPVAAGLAGGSSDAAAVLKGINNLFSLNISESDLMKMGSTLGADVPFCIRGGTMLSEGIGDVLTDMPTFDGIFILLVKPKIGVSTRWVYKNLNLDSICARPNTDMVIRSIAIKDLALLANSMGNVLESVTIKKYNELSGIKQKLLEKGALGSMMSGSGPTIFGIFSTRNTAESAYLSLKENYSDVFLTETVGPDIITIKI